MPLFYTSPRVGFSVPEWARIWGTFFLVQPVTNVVWGLIGDRIGCSAQSRAQNDAYTIVTVWIKRGDAR